MTKVRMINGFPRIPAGSNSPIGTGRSMAKKPPFWCTEEAEMNELARHLDDVRVEMPQPHQEFPL